MVDAIWYEDQHIRIGSAALRAETLDILGDYLDPAHLGLVRQGCTFAALTGDAARAGAATRRTYSTALRAFMAELKKAVDDRHQPERSAILSTVLAIGAITIAGAVSDRRLAATILDTCRDEIERQLGP